MSSRSRPATVLAATLTVLSLVLSGCGDGDAPDPAADGTPSLLVVATTSILGDIVGRVVGDEATIDVLMEAGVDPHGFSPSAQDAQTLRDADLVVANGLRLEESLVDLLAAAEEDGVRVLEIAPELDPRPVERDEHHPEDEHGDEPADGHDSHDDHGGLDPHVWYDPVRMATAAGLIADAMAQVDEGASQAGWEQRGGEVADEILAAHERALQILDAVPQRCRVLVTNHDSFGYFAERYGFEIIGTVLPGTSSQAEPSAQDIAALVEAVERSEVPALFGETSRPTRLAETLAAEVGRDIEVVALFTDALGPEGSGADSYTGMIVTNAQRIADALATC